MSGRHLHASIFVVRMLRLPRKHAPRAVGERGVQLCGLQRMVMARRAGSGFGFRMVAARAFAASRRRRASIRTRVVSLTMLYEKVGRSPRRRNRRRRRAEPPSVHRGLRYPQGVPEDPAARSLRVDSLRSAHSESGWKVEARVQRRGLRSPRSGSRGHRPLRCIRSGAGGRFDDVATGRLNHERQHYGHPQRSLDRGLGR